MKSCARFLRGSLPVCIALLASSTLLPAQEAGVPGATREAKTKPLAVTDTFNHAAFEYTIEPMTDREAYTIHKVCYPSPVVTDLPQNNTVQAEYFLPKGMKEGDAPRPAVVCLHILNGDFGLVRLLSSALASRGIPAIWFKMPYYGERGPPEGTRALLKDGLLFSKVLPQGMKDIRRTVDLLASRPEIDGTKIGVAGISLGGILAGSAPGFEPRLQRAGLILAGGDLLKIVNHAHETRGIRKMLAGLDPIRRAEIEELARRLDPLTHAAVLRKLAQSNRLLMINAAEDHTIPRECTERLAEAAGISDQVIWLDGLGHYTAMVALGDVLKTTVDFFAQDLPPGAEPPPIAPLKPAAEATPFQVVLGILQQLSSMLFTPPESGHCHLADVNVQFQPKKGKKQGGSLRYVRGSGKKFTLECKLPQIGAVSMGHGTFPWITGAGKKVFKGILEPVDVAHPLAYANEQHVMKVRMVQGIVAAATLGMGSFDQYVTATRSKTADGAPVLLLKGAKDPNASVSVFLAKDGRTPLKAEARIKGFTGTVTFTTWETGTVAPDGLFEPPADLPEYDVRQDDVYRTFAAIFNFALENVE